MRLGDLRKMDRGELLEALGMEPERKASDWLLPGIGLFALGLMVGAGVGMLVSPRLMPRMKGELEPGWAGPGEMPESTTHSQAAARP